MPARQEPYPNSRKVILDVTKNSHLIMIPTRSAYGDMAFRQDTAKPLLAEFAVERIFGTVPLVNDILCIVYDYLGYIKE
jgi:hypothetical protein